MALYHYSAIAPVTSESSSGSRYFSGSVQCEVITSHAQYTETAKRIAVDNGADPEKCAILSLSKLD